MSLKTELICDICNMVLRNPRTLPCGCTICNNHLIHIDKIKCITCDEEFIIPQTGFKLNKVVQKILEKRAHLNAEEETLKVSIENIIQKLDRLLISFKSNAHNTDLMCNLHFDEIRRNIDIKREELKVKVDDIALKMIDSTKEKEIIFMQKLKKHYNHIVQIDTQKMNLELEEELRKQSTFMLNLKQLKLNYEQSLAELQLNLIEFNTIKDEMFLHQFKLNRNFEIENFGFFELNKKKYLCTCSSDKTIKIWDLEAKKLLKNLNEHLRSVQCLDIYCDEYIISCSWDKTIKIWNTDGTCKKTFQGHLQGVTCLRLMNINTLASGSKTEIKLWNLINGECVKTLIAHDNWIRSLVVLLDGTLVSCSDDKTIKHWDLIDEVCIRTLNGHDAEVLCLCLLKNDCLASGSEDKTIKIWNIKNGECITTIAGHVGWICGLQLKNDYELISCSEDSTIKLWNLNTFECFKTLTGHTGSVRCIKYDGSLLISGSSDKTAKVWNLYTGECIQTFEGHQEAVLAVNCF